MTAEATYVSPCWPEDVVVVFIAKILGPHISIGILLCIDFLLLFARVHLVRLLRFLRRTTCLASAVPKLIIAKNKKHQKTTSNTALAIYSNILTFNFHLFNWVVNTSRFSLLLISKYKCMLKFILVMEISIIHNYCQNEILRRTFKVKLSHNSIHVFIILYIFHFQYFPRIKVLNYILMGFFKYIEKGGRDLIFKNRALIYCFMTVHPLKV